MGELAEYESTLPCLQLKKHAMSSRHPGRHGQGDTHSAGQDARLYGRPEARRYMMAAAGGP
jgi:hypothetical protein